MVGEAGNLEFCTLARDDWEWGVLAVECAIAAALLIIVLVLPPRPPGRKVKFLIFFLQCWSNVILQRWITAVVFGASFIPIAVIWGVLTGPSPITFYACLIVLAGVDVIFAVIIVLLFTVWKEDGDKKDLDSELQRINKTRPSVSQNTPNPIQPTAKVPESGSEESDEEEDEDEDSEEEDDEESDEEEEEDEEEDEDDSDSDNSESSSGGKQQRPAMIAKPSNTGLQPASSSEGSEGSSGSEQSSSEGSGSSESS